MDELVQYLLIEMYKVFGTSLTRGILLLITAIELYCILDLSLFLLKHAYWWFKSI